jgi:16S rRNA (guanine527-N7)-methyltransferase
LSAEGDERLRRWFDALIATPGLTSLAGDEAWRVHVDESLAALGVVRRFEGPIVDVGSGGGAPGIPLAAALSEREVTLLESSRRKCEFLERWARELPNLRVVCGRAEEQPLERWGVALAKALATPPVAAEWTLPLVASGGAALLFVGPSAEAGRVARVAELLAAELAETPRGLFVLRKLGPTPPGFPRRPGMARKRPLA